MRGWTGVDTIASEVALFIYSEFAASRIPVVVYLFWVPVNYLSTRELRAGGTRQFTRAESAADLNLHIPVVPGINMDTMRGEMSPFYSLKSTQVPALPTPQLSQWLLRLYPSTIPL